MSKFYDSADLKCFCGAYTRVMLEPGEFERTVICSGCSMLITYHWEMFPKITSTEKNPKSLAAVLDEAGVLDDCKPIEIDSLDS